MKLRSIVESIMGSREYKPPVGTPEDTMNLMADFYMVELLQNGTRHIESHRTDAISHEINHVESVIVPHLREFLLDCLGFSIISEASNFPFHAKVFAYSSDDNDQICDKCGLIGVPCSCYDIYWLTSLLGPDLTNVLKKHEKGDHEEDREAVRQYYELIVKAGPTIFDGQDVVWDSMYGGKPWVDACKLWYKLKNTNGINNTKHAIDMVFQAQHNTGSILNKNYEFKGQWLPLLLNLKYEANDPEQLIRMCSPYIKKLAGYVLNSKFGRSLQGVETQSIDPHNYYLLLAKKELSDLPARASIEDGSLILRMQDGHHGTVAVSIEPINAIVDGSNKMQTIYYVDKYDYDGDQYIRGEDVDLKGLRRVVGWFFARLKTSS